MSAKGGISFPMVIVVAIIIAAIVLALAYIFIFNTKTNIEESFADLTKSVTSFACSGLGIASGALCPS
jgi:uncharacterized protein YoxC